MTRWARSGNTQKHKKMPGDATPWKNFSRPPKTKWKFSKQFSKNEKKVEKDVSSGIVNNHESKLDKFPKASFSESPTVNSFSECAQVISNSNRNRKFHAASVKKESLAIDKNLAQCRKRKKHMPNKHAKKIKIETEEDTHDSHPNIEMNSSYSESKNSSYGGVQNEDNHNGLQLHCKKESRNVIEKLCEKKVKRMNRKKARKLLKQKMKNSECKSSSYGDVQSEDNHDGLQLHCKQESRNDREKLCEKKVERMNSKKAQKLLKRKNSECKSSLYGDVQSEDDHDGLQLHCKEESRNDREKLCEKKVERMNRKKARKLLKQKMKSNKLINKPEDNSVSELENGDQHKNNVNEHDLHILDNQKGSDVSKPVVKTVSDAEKKKKKKLVYMEKLKRNRAEKGIILLPTKVERKLYIIRKKLRERKVPVEVLKEIMRKERRKEELKFRKTFPSKTCFNCRQTGHILAECPVPAGPSRKAGSCFKCGSEEHTSYKCPNKIAGYPLATCFICKQQGHISRDCPDNAHGVYPKGGKCNLCGNVNHLRKDCPFLSEKGEENTMAVHTIIEGTSIDADIVDRDNVIKEDKKSKKLKVVKF